MRELVRVVLQVLRGVLQLHPQGYGLQGLQALHRVGVALPLLVQPRQAWLGARTGRKPRRRRCLVPLHAQMIQALGPSDLSARFL